MGVSGLSGPRSRLRAGFLWQQGELNHPCTKGLLEPPRFSAYPSEDPSSSMSSFAHGVSSTSFLSLSSTLPSPPH